MHEGIGDGGLGEVRPRGEGLGIRELDADHQAAAADLGHVRVARRGLTQAVEQAVAEGFGPGGQALVLEHVEGRERGRARHRVAAVGAAVAPGGNRFSSSREARMPDSGMPEAMPLAMTTMSGRTPLHSVAKKRPVRP